jgi:hypothetical protein
MTLLADIYSKQGRLDEAEALSVRAVGDEEQQNDPDYDTLDRQLRLASVY